MKRKEYDKYTWKENVFDKISLVFKLDHAMEFFDFNFVSQTFEKSVMHTHKLKRW